MADKHKYSEDQKWFIALKDAEMRGDKTIEIKIAIKIRDILQQNCIDRENELLTNERKTTPNSNYAKCIEEIIEYFLVNDQPSIHKDIKQILKKHFA